MLLHLTTNFKPKKYKIIVKKTALNEKPKIKINL